MRKKQVGIIGAGVSGLLACKYTIEKGLNPVVFEAGDTIGGVWAHTANSTRLQNTKNMYQFSDFPWPDWVKDMYPKHNQVMEYLKSYAKHFGLFPHIKLNSKVLGIDYVGESCEEIESFVLWGGNGKPFGSKGKWHIKVQDTLNFNTKVYKMEFVILCIGAFSGLPNIPELPESRGPKVFKGKVMHSMDYCDMEFSSAEKLVKGKRVAIIGSRRSATEIAVECANVNGVQYPCNIIQRTAHWYLPSDYLCGFLLSFLYFNRFSELMVNKPGESFSLKLLATLLSPLRWTISKLVETYLKWNLSLKKHGMLPKYSFSQDVSSCQVAVLPDTFYEKLQQGSIAVKNSQSFSFFENGLILEGETQPLETDIVIFATGFKGDVKLKNMFEDPFLQEHIMGSPSSPISLYRQVLHPRIPQLAIVGYVHSLSALGASEIRCQWLAQFLGGNIELPSLRDMEIEANMWGEHIKRVTDKYYRRSCISNTNIWYNDQMCMDMGCHPKRKKGFFQDLFLPYKPTDYAGLTSRLKDS